MAIRRSGGLTIRIALQGADGREGDRYRCSLSDGQNRQVIFVLPPRALTKALDSSEAYDEAAHAAISVADPGLQWAAEGDAAGEGWKITRG